MYKHILVPVDVSAADRTIVEHIRGLAKFCSARISFLHVADGFAARYRQPLNLVDSEEMIKDRLYLKSLEDEFTDAAFSVRSHLATGDPVKEILGYAYRENCDLIAMSTHGHGVIKDILLGTVAEGVRHRTNIPVLLLRVPQ